MLESNPAPIDHSIHPLLQNRWSSRAITDEAVSEEMANQLLEAARWTASSYNEQPWLYVLGHKGSEMHKKLSQCLLDGNAWAREGGLLILSIAKTFFDHKHKPNRHYMHDVGAANNQLVLQATELGLHTHEMGGFDADKARELFNIDEEYEPACIIMVAHPGDGSNLPPELQEREKAPRQRKTLEEMMWKV